MDLNRTVLWNVSDVGLMEILDDGTLVIYDSDTNSGNRNSSSKVVWKSSTAVLFPGQKLLLGQQLTSNDSAYSASVQDYGLALQMNSIKYLDPTYSFLAFNGSGVVCTDASTYVKYVTSPLDPDYDGSFGPYLLGRSCLQGAGHNASFFALASSALDVPPSNFSFLSLETDSKLYIVIVVLLNSGGSMAINRFPVDSDVYLLIIYQWTPLEEQLWNGCEGPMACGPLGVCSPGAPSLCSCQFLGQNFSPLNDRDLQQRCRHIQPLQNCTTRRDLNSTTTLLQLDDTASIFLFNQSPTQGSTPSLMFGSMEVCKEKCLSDCLCQGLIHDASNLIHPACYFINENIGSLLHLQNYTTSLIFECQ